MSLDRSKLFFLIFFLCLNTCFLFSQNRIEDSSFEKVRTVPEWLEKGVIYQIQPRAFTKSGTIKEATENLSRIKDLGATIIYLCPVFKMDGDTSKATWSKRQILSSFNTPYNPYRIVDYFHVDSKFGSDDDLRSFVLDAHKLGLKVMLDLVYYHCGGNAVFLKDHPEYIKRDKNGNPITGTWNWPELNFSDKGLREYLIANMEFLLSSIGVDGFRCDVASGVPLDFWEEARERMEKLNLNIGMLAESSERIRPKEQLRAFDAGYSFEWFNTLKNVIDGDSPASLLREKWEMIRQVSTNGARFIRYTDNHDLSNDSYYNRNEERWGLNAMNAGFVLNFFIDGIPFIYNGQEVADMSRNSIWGDLSIHWFNINSIAGKQRFEFLKSLINLYKSEVIFATGKLRWLNNKNPDSVISFLRENENERVLVIINIKNKQVEVRLEDLGVNSSSVKILLKDNSGSTLSGDNFKIKPYGFGLFRITNN